LDPQDAPGPGGSRPTSAKRGRGWLVRLAVALVALLAAFLVGRFTAPKSIETASTVVAPAAASPSPEPDPSVTITPSPSVTVSGTDSSTPTATSTAAGVGSAATGSDTVNLADFTPVSGSFGNDDPSPVINGKSQLYAVSTSLGCDGDGDVQYDLGRDYTQFTALLGIDDGSQSQSAAPSVEIDGDGLKLGTWAPTLGKPVTIKINVTDVLRLEFKWTDPGLCGNGSAYLVFGDGQLTPVPGFATTPSPSAND
jgi:hypothetical protein